MSAETGPLYVFAYGSLVSAASAAETLGRDEVLVQPAVLRGWERSFTLARDNRRCEKTFAAPDGSVPEIVLALNVEPDPSGRAEVNGALIELSPEEFARLDLRELRYDRVDVSGAVHPAGDPGAARTACTYTAKPGNRAAGTPAGSVVLAAYERTVEAAFAELGPDQLEAFRRTTRDCPAPRIEGVLVTDDIPAGNPRAW